MDKRLILPMTSVTCLTRITGPESYDKAQQDVDGRAIELWERARFSSFAKVSPVGC